MKKSVTVFLTLMMMLVLASVASAQSLSYNSSIQIANLDDTTDATAVVTFYDSAGTAQTYNTSITAGSSVTLFPLPEVSAGFDGSAVISSDTPVAAIVNVVANGFDYGASYGGFDAGAEEVSLPLIMKNNGGFNTWFNVQNAGSADTTVTVEYAGTSCQETATIKVGAAARFEQEDNACLGTKYVGAATVTAASGGEIVASVMEVGETTLFAYNGFVDDGSTAPVIPLVNANNAGYETGIALQNVGSSSTTVTLTYTPAGAGTACTETQTIAPSASANFAFTAFATSVSGENCADGARFVGSATVTTNSADMPLVGIVNQLNLAAQKGSAYNAFDPSVATDTVVMPLIMDRNSGFFTGMNVMNVGTASAVTCTYVRASDNATIKTETSSVLQNGEAFNVLHSNYLANAFVGSATCTADTAGGLLLAQVNELGGGSGDQLFTYEGVNK